MDANALNNALKTPEAQQMVALLGEQGFTEYLTSLFDRVGGNFDELVKHLSIHALAAQRLGESGGRVPTYQELSQIPTSQELIGAPQTTYPIAPSPVVTMTPPPVRMPTPQPVPSAPPQQGQPLQQSMPQAPRASVTPAPVRGQVLSGQAGPRNAIAQGDIVNAFGPNAVMTSGIGGYPGHVGEDFAYTDQNSFVTNPIGGIPFTGYQQGGYGNYLGVIGANPQEAAQMSPQERLQLIMETQRKMPRAGNLTELNTPGRNVSILGHLAQVPKVGNYVATGSAQLQMGNTGRSTGKHTHVEIKDIGGNLRSYSQMLGSTVSKGQGGKGGGTTRNVVNDALQSFKSIVRPPPVSQSKPVVRQSTPKPTPSPTIRQSVPASRTGPIQSPARYTAPKPAPTPRPPMQSVYRPVIQSKPQQPPMSRPSPIQSFYR